MNLGMNSGFSLNGEQVVVQPAGMDVITATGKYTTKGSNFEITLIGGGQGGSTNSSGGLAGGNVIKRIIGLPVGTVLDVIIGGEGVADTTTSNSSICSIPAFQTLNTGDRTTAPTGGDINLQGQLGMGMDQNGLGGFGGSTLLGFGGRPTQRGFGYGSGSGAGTTGGGVQSGQPGVMVVRYF